MKTIILASLAAGGLALLLAGPAAAQTANGTTPASSVGGFTAKTVDPLHPFGAINTYNVGTGAGQVSAWAKTLDAARKQEMVGRCSVIIKNQQNYYWETGTFCQNFALAVAENATKSGDAVQ